MARKLALQLTIRQRFFIGMLFFTVSLTVIGILSFTDLVQIKELTQIVAEVQQLNNDLLETRRFEKNFLLYANSEDGNQAKNYMGQARLLATDIADKRGKATVRSAMDTLRNILDAYEQSFDALLAVPAGDVSARSALVEDIRRHGKEMVRLAEEFTDSEAKRILRIIDQLKMQLLASVLTALGLGAIMSMMMFGRLFITLSIIQSATKRIARGIFEPLPEVGGRSDAKAIVTALNALVHELELRQTQLLNAQKLSSIGTLAAGIAHQLNNPLNNISTSSQILLEEKSSLDPAFLEKLLNNIESESQRAKEIVQGLLEFSREKNFTLVREPLHVIVSKTRRLVSSQIPGNVEFVIDVPQDLYLLVDIQHFQEALLNLIINAVQAMQPDPGTISIQANRLKDEVLLRVSDTGKGIPPDIKGRIFDPFFSTKDVGDGTGLGLSIAYGIVKKHGGRIDVESEENHGTTFKIVLPAAPEEGAANA